MRPKIKMNARMLKKIKRELYRRNLSVFNPPIHVLMGGVELIPFERVPKR